MIPGRRLNRISNRPQGHRFALQKALKPGIAEVEFIHYSSFAGNTADAGRYPLLSMTAIRRLVMDALNNADSGRIAVVSSPARCGKSSVLQAAVREYGGEEYRFFDARNGADAAVLTFRSEDEVAELLKGAQLLVIDNVQCLPDAGTTVKLLADIREYRGLTTKILVASSASFYAVAGRESALGRVKTCRMSAFTVAEARLEFEEDGQEDFEATKERFPLYGLLPEVPADPTHAREFLTDYCNSVLLRDIETVCVGGLRADKDAALRYLRAVARNIGRPVTDEMMADEAGMSTDAARLMRRILCESLIVRACEEEGNLIGSAFKLYVFDNGVVNALLGDFTPLSDRADAGALRENFIAMERIKLHDAREDFIRLMWNDGMPGFTEVPDGRREEFDCGSGDFERIFE